MTEQDTTNRLAEGAIKYHKGQIKKPRKSPLIPEGKGIVAPLVSNQFPHYFGLWHGKSASLGDINAENINLEHAVKTHIDNGVFVGEHNFDYDAQGNIIYDVLVSSRILWERPKLA